MTFELITRLQFRTLLNRIPSGVFIMTVHLILTGVVCSFLGVLHSILANISPHLLSNLMLNVAFINSSINCSDELQFMPLMN